MKIKPAWLLALAAVAFLCIVGWGSKAQSASRAAWEYKVVTLYGTNDTPPPNLTQFNQMGAEGWELVTALSEESTRVDKRQVKTDYYFKRAR
jgi:hypothetical protein